MLDGVEPDVFWSKPVSRVNSVPDSSWAKAGSSSPALRPTRLWICICGICNQAEYNSTMGVPNDTARCQQTGVWTTCPESLQSNNNNNEAQVVILQKLIINHNTKLKTV